MEKFISLKELIKLAKQEGIDLGKGDPYNRLRYYTKMGWLPHMTRKTNEKGNIEGHYPTWVISALKKIQEFKDEGLSNEQVEQKIKLQNNFQKTFAAVINKKTRKTLVIIGIVLVLVLILLTELDIIKVNKPKDMTPTLNTDASVFYIIDSGTGILPKGAQKAVIKTGKVNATTKINVTFKDNYAPASRYWVSNNEEQDGFTVNMDTPVANDCDFHWFISN